MFDGDPIFMVISFGILVYSFVLHELGHAWVAFKCGDPTAKMQGRLTFNPIPHIDPMGTLLVPAVCFALTGGRAFLGWPKSTPISPSMFRHPFRDDILVSLAGIGAHIAIVLAAGVVNSIVHPGGLAGTILLMVAICNLSLIILNLLPIPPFDGWMVLRLFLPEETRRNFEQFGWTGGVLILMLVVNSDIYRIFSATVILGALRLLGFERLA